MLNLVAEMAVRYAVSGLIMYAALYVGLIVRILVLVLKGSYGSQARILNRGRRLHEFVNTGTTVSRWEMAVRYVVWPYGIIKILSNYLKIEPVMIKEMMNGDF